MSFNRVQSALFLVVLFPVLGLGEVAPKTKQQPEKVETTLRIPVDKDTAAVVVHIKGSSSSPKAIIDVTGGGKRFYLKPDASLEFALELSKRIEKLDLDDETRKKVAGLVTGFANRPAMARMFDVTRSFAVIPTEEDIENGTLEVSLEGDNLSFVKTIRTRVQD